MVDAWETLGDVLESGGQLEAAVEARRRAVETSGGAPEQALKLAPLLLQLGRVEEARAHASLAVDAFPSTAHTVLARIAMAGGDLAGAEREARAAAATRGATVTPALTLAEVLAARGDADGALAVIADLEDELESRSLPDPRPFLLRAELLRARGDAAAEPRRPSTRHRSSPDRLLALDASAPVGLGRARAHLRPARRSRSVDRSPARERARQKRRRRPGAGAADPPRRARALARAARAARGARASRAAQRRRSRSRVRLERALELDPEGANAWNLLGVARWQSTRDGGGAIAAWERALELDPARWEALYNVARVASETQRRDLARDALERFVAGAPPDRYADDLAAARAALAQLGRAGSSG